MKQPSTRPRIPYTHAQVNHITMQAAAGAAADLQFQQLQQGQQAMQQQLQQILQLLQQGQQNVGPQTRRQLAEARAMAARAQNATQPLGVTLAQVPITTGPQMVIGTVPANYPATVFAFDTLTGPQATALLQAYGQPANGNVSAKRTRLAEYLGIQYRP
jgi:hypothetical protein